MCKGAFVYQIFILKFKKNTYFLSEIVLFWIEKIDKKKLKGEIYKDET
jgi:hypothetical protein